MKTQIAQTPKTNPDPGEGWRLLTEGEKLQEGDGYQHPEFGELWIDYACRPDLFRGEFNEVAHTWPWRRRIG